MFVLIPGSYFYFVNKIIYAIFLDSIYVLVYDIFFLFLTYFPRYISLHVHLRL